ncbi:MAG: MFS transporter [Anaerolineae bacterium]|jgi:MFS family permease|nr:MFS transporter [Anaerolineae bacterium]
MNLTSWLTGPRRPVMLMLCYSALFHVGLMGMADVVLNFYFVSLGYEVQTIGLLQSLPRLGGLLTGVPVGLLANRIGTYRVVLYATLGYSLTYAMLVLLPALPTLMLSYFLIGFMYGAQQIALMPLMMALAEKDFRTRFFAYHNVVSLASMAVGSMVAGRLPAIIVGLFAGIAPAAFTASATTPFAYGITLLIAAVLTALSVLPFLLIRVTADHPAVSLEKLKKVRIPWGFLLRLNFPLLLFGFTGGLTFPFYNLFFRTQFNLPDATVGTILSAGWLGMGLLPLLNPWLEARYGRAVGLGIVMAIAAAGFMVLGLAGALLLAVVAYLVAASFRNVFQNLFQPLMMDYLPVELHNMTTSIGIVLWNIGWMFATATGGTLQKVIGYGAMMQMVAVGVLLTGISVVVIFRQRELDSRQNRVNV